MGESIRTIAKPTVLIIGGPDVDGRIELIRTLNEHFHFFAAGTASHLHPAFQQAACAYDRYPMVRGVNPFADVRTLLSLISLFRHLRPDLVHAFDTKPCVFARLAARLTGVPVVVGTLPGLGSLYVGDGITVRMARMVYEHLQRFACHLSDLTIFQNHHDAQKFIGRDIVSAAKATIIPGSGVRTDVLNPTAVSESERKRVRAELGIGSNALLVTMVSRLIRSKGVEDFVTSAQTLRQHHPWINFLLVGPPDEESLDRLAPAELSQLTRNVIWPGARKDIPAILAASDIFVLPSFYREGIPRVLLEAASMGLPIVTTDSPGCSEVVEQGVNGFLVPVRDPDALSQAILRLVEDPGVRHRFGQKSRQRAIARFDLSRIASQIHSIYWDLLAQKGLLRGEA